MVVEMLLSSEPLLRTPLSHDMCQRIHSHALQSAVKGISPAPLPECIQIDQLRQQVTYLGPDVYIVPAEELATIFRHMTFAIYHTIESLYCSRIGRSITMVWQIVQTILQGKQQPSISYEAFWATCLFLDTLRQESVSVSIERGQERWWVGAIMLPLTTLLPDGRMEERVCFLCVVDLQQQRVLAYRPTTELAQEQDAGLALYEAIVTLRRPRPRMITGLRWHLPRQIQSIVPLSSPCRRACQRLGIVLEEMPTSPTPPPFLLRLLERWAAGLAGKTFPLSQCLLLFDHYLAKTSSYGPMRRLAEQEEQYSDLVGYMQDPSWVFPLLRVFLPSSEAFITNQGLIEYDGLHYEDELLVYFPDRAVTLRRPPEKEALVWVYLEGRILSQAWARELRRRDGTYRASRPGRTGR